MFPLRSLSRCLGGEVKTLLRTTNVLPASSSTLSVRSAHHKHAMPSVYTSETIPSTYGGRHTISLIPAHGIGPQLISGVRDVFVTAGVPVDFHEAHLEGNTSEERFQSFEEILLAVKRNGVAIKGNWITE